MEILDLDASHRLQYTCASSGVIHYEILSGQITPQQVATVATGELEGAHPSEVIPALLRIGRETLGVR